MDEETREAKLAELRDRIRLAREARLTEAQTDVFMLQKMVAVSQFPTLLSLQFELLDMGKN